MVKAIDLNQLSNRCSQVSISFGSAGSNPAGVDFAPSFGQLGDAFMWRVDIVNGELNWLPVCTFFELEEVQWKQIKK